MLWPGEAVVPEGIRVAAARRGHGLEGLFPGDGGRLVALTPLARRRTVRGRARLGWPDWLHLLGHSTTSTLAEANIGPLSTESVTCQIPVMW